MLNRISVDVTDYLLKDEANEDKLGTTLVDILKRAEEVKGKGGLLAGKLLVLVCYLHDSSRIPIR